MYKVPKNLQTEQPLTKAPKDGLLHTVIVPAGADLSAYLTPEGIAIVELLRKYAKEHKFGNPTERRVEIYALPNAAETELSKSGHKFHVDPETLGPDAVAISGISFDKGMYVGSGITNFGSYPLIFVIKEWRASDHEFGSDKLHTYSLAVASNWTIYELIDEPIAVKELYEKHPSCKPENNNRAFVG